MQVLEPIAISTTKIAQNMSIRYHLDANYISSYGLSYFMKTKWKSLEKLGLGKYNHIKRAI